MRERQISQMKRYFSILFACTYLLSYPCYGHESELLHKKDFQKILCGYGRDISFDELSKVINTGVDHDLPTIFRNKIGTIPANHRILGHGCSLGAPIPEEILVELERTYPGRRGEIIDIWARFSEDTVEKVMRLTNLPKKQAGALAGILHNVHLLGDYEPDNTAIKYVLKPNDAAKNIIKDCRELFPNSPPTVRKIDKNLRGILKEYRGKDAQYLARALQDELMHLELGVTIDKHWHNTMNIRFSDESLTAARAQMTERLMSRAVGKTEDLVTPRNKPLQEEIFGKIRGGRITKPAIATKNGKLLIPLSAKEMQLLKPGVTVPASGVVLAIAVDGGSVTYQYIKGNIGKRDFERGLAEAAIKGGAAGAGAAVAITLGATPAGWVVLAASTAAYELTDLALEACEEKPLTPDDLRSFHIDPSSPLDTPSGTILDFEEESPLDTPTDTVFDLVH